ncbi:MAG: hypothetical protein QXD71_02620 [Candidatus Pacearchaeota archaeon]
MVELKKEIDFERGCEECGIVEELFNTITNGRPMRLCKRCALSNNSFILPTKKTEREQEQRQKAETTKKSIEAFTLNDLYERYREIKAKKMQQKYEVMQEENFLKDLEKEQIQEIEEIKKAVDEHAIEFDFRPEKTKKLKVGDLMKLVLEKIKGKKKETKESTSVTEAINETTNQNMQNGS